MEELSWGTHSTTIICEHFCGLESSFLIIWLSYDSFQQLERFLVANREEYLRHSALNYTVQQKQYNNRLTDELLELATQHGYIFDTNDFSYVTVRDRIRCYFKSYVQSAKKRGVLMGYAARKAGLLDEEELEMGGTGDLAPIIKSP